MRSEAQETAYVEFVTARQDDLRRLAVALTGDLRRADEVLDAALVRLYAAWSRLQRDGAEETYVRRLVLRAQPAPSGDAIPALRGLPARQRRAVLLVAWLGLTPSEAAEELGMSVGAVRTAAARALATLESRPAQLPAEAPGAGRRPAAVPVPGDLRDRIDAELGTALGEAPPLRPVGSTVAVGRRVRRRRRRLLTLATASALALAALSPLLVRQQPGPGGGIDDKSPLPGPISTPVPIPVHLLIAPPRYVRPDTPPVLYLFGRMFKRAKDVTVLATFGEIDTALHPQGGAIVRIGDRTSWVAVVGNEPHHLLEQRTAPYDYTDFTAWATDQFSVMSGRYALAATAPGPYRPPVSDSASPAEYVGARLVAKPGGTIVQRIDQPVVSPFAVRPCDDQAVQVRTRHGDWFVLGYDCAGQGALYSEPVGVRATDLASWLVQVKRVQDAYAS